MNSLWGAGQMMFNKFLFIVKEDVKVSDPKAVLKAISDRCHPVDDILSSRGPMDVLDHASQKFAFGGKMGWDATGEEKPWKPTWNSEVMGKIPEVLEANTSLLEENISILLLRIKKDQKQAARKIARQLIDKDAFKEVKFVVFMEEVTDLSAIGDVVWRGGQQYRSSP